MGPEEVDEWERMGNFLLFYVQLGPSAPLNFQFSIFFLFFHVQLVLLSWVKICLEHCNQLEAKKFGKIVVLPWIWKGLFQMEWGSDCYEPSENI